MLIDDKIIEVQVYPTNRKFYEERIGSGLINGQLIEVRQKDVPPSARADAHFECDVCGVTYVAKRNTQKGPTHNTYCSQDCHKEGKRRSMIKRNPNPKKDKIDVNCWTCDKSFKVVPSVYKKQDTFCCSRKCYQDRRREKGFNILNKETDIEKIVRLQLESMGVEFETQKSIYPYWCDFYIPESKLVLEVYGDYWHANPKKYGLEDAEDKYKEVWMNDVKRANNIIGKGYGFQVLWGDTIKNNSEETERLINKYLKNN